MVEFRCTCGFNGEVEDELAGNRVKCPRCGTVVARPRAETQGIKAAGESVHVPLREAVPLRKMKILKKSLGITFLAVFMCFMFSVAFGADDHSTRMTFIRALEWGGWLLIAAMIIGGFPVYQYFYFKRYFYDIEGDNLIIRKGVIAYREVTLPFSKITDIYVDRDIMDAMLGLSDVHVSTPTDQSGKLAHIDGVSEAGAVRIRQMILDRVNPGKLSDK